MKKTLLARCIGCIAPLMMFLASPPVIADGDAELQQLLSMSLEKLMTMKVSISTSTPQELSKAPSVVSVITAEDIKATGTTNLMEILQSTPGIFVKTNLFAFRPLIYFRGTSSSNALFMVNGAPVRDLAWAAGIFAKGLPANMIERVEIIRGPGSALYGADAAAGVINVITKSAAPISQSEAGVRAGSFDSQSAWLQHGAHWNGFHIAFTADVSHTGGHRPFIAQDRLGNAGVAEYGWNSQDFHLSIGKDSWKLLADHGRHDNVAVGLTGAAVLDSVTRASDSQTSLALLYDNPHFAREWGLNAEVRYRDLDYDSGNGFWERLPAVTLNQLSVAERRFNVEAGGLYRGFQDHAIRLGGGYVWQDPYRVRTFFDGVPKNFMPETARKNAYLFLQDVWSLDDDWQLTAGARYDNFSDFGSTLNPRLALVWQTTERLTTKLMYGQAFRAPSYLELYSETAANIPNANLKPEKSKTLELAFSWLASRDLKLGANLYRLDRRNIIAPDPVTNRYENFGNCVTHGMELESQWQATHTLRLAANLSYAADDDSAVRDRTIPLHRAYLRADWAFRPKWTWNLQANWLGNRPLLPGDPRAPIGPYATTDTTIRYYHGSEWEFAASIRNLFDQDARDYSSTRLPYNLPLPGRSLFAEARFKF